MLTRRRLDALKERGAKLLEDRHNQSSGIAAKITPKRAAKKPTSRLVPIPAGPDDMTDPRSPELQQWLKTLPRADRVVMMMALAVAYPRLNHDTPWQAQIRTDVIILKSGGLPYDEIRRRVAHHVVSMSREFGAMEERALGEQLRRLAG